MIRHSTAPPRETNPLIKPWHDTFRGRPNSDFFAAAMDGVGRDNAHLSIGLVGQRDLTGVAVRRAQAILRWDLRPSLWSHAFVVVVRDGRPAVRHVALHPRSPRFPDPAGNAVIDGELSQFDDHRIDANVALLHVPLATDEERAKVAERALINPNLDRLRYDLWHLLGVWQSFFWSAGEAPNPLREGIPEPSASFVDYCFDAIRLDLTPGASERNSAPEHLWNTAQRWHHEFERLGRPISGAWVMRDPYCTLLDPEELDDAAAPHSAGAG
jgi:hypothetical protein